MGESDLIPWADTVDIGSSEQTQEFILKMLCRVAENVAAWDAESLVVTRTPEVALALGLPLSRAEAVQVLAGNVVPEPFHSMVRRYAFGGETVKEQRDE